MSQTLLSAVEAGAALAGQGSPAVVVPDGPTLSYQRVLDLAAAAADALQKRGVGPGDRVAMVYPNGPEAIVLFLAAAAVGTCCPLNSAYKEEEFRFYLEDTGARHILLPPGGGEAARRALPDGATVIEMQITAAGTLEVDGRGTTSTAAGTTGPDDVALVLHTSGTTSRPKRVPLRQRHVTASMANIVSHYALGSEDRSFCVMPLFHVHGLVASALATLSSGGTVIAPRRFNPLGFWPEARATRPTWFSASPAPHELILMRAAGIRPPGTESLRFVRSCSSALSPDQMARMEECYGAPVLEAYGMTEASHQMASNPLPPADRRPGSVGPGTGVEVRAVDERWASLPTGTPGEIVIRGPNVTDGYESNPEANAESFKDGWFRTGDQGTVGDDGYVVLVGRLKELINRGGEKIGPREVDEVLESHDAVVEAVAFASPHPVWGEEVAAAVVVSSAVTEKELQAFCRQRLADFKVPTRIHIVEAIPRTATGKVQRRLVAEKILAGG